MALLEDKDILLFQGDSITDAGRNETPDGLGWGYVALIAGTLPVARSGDRINVLNRGVSGDRTVELLARWKTDCEDLRPSVLSVMIGVNDVWRHRESWNGQTYVGPEEFVANYRKLLDRALACGVRRLVLCSPTTIDDAKSTDLQGLLDERVSLVKDLAVEYGALYVPLAEAQKSLLSRRPDIAWTQDGCHPTLCGHAALARVWVETVLARD